MSHWSLLGIDPTDDKSAIRRAYARQLKRMGAERDADAFHRLRAAREAALDESNASLAALRPLVDVSPREAKGETGEADADRTRVRQMQTGPRVKIVETDVLDDEGGCGLLCDDAVDLDAVVADLEAQVVACLDPSRTSTGVHEVGALQPVLSSIADLPRDRRRALERFCLTQLAAHLTKPNGEFDAAGALRVRSLVRACDDSFGWTFDDDIVHASLGPRDAETLMLMLDLRDDPVVPVRRPPAARLRRFDAQALLERSPRLLSIYKAVAAGADMPWRFNIWAALAPHLWALYRRYWAVAGAWYLVGIGVAFVALAARPGDRGLIALSGAVTCCLLIASGFLADRTVFLYAWRMAQKADRLGLYEPTVRKLFLRKRDSRLNIGVLIYFTLISAWVSLLPYAGVARWFRVLP